MRNFKIAKGMRANSSTIKNVTASWGKLVEVFTSHIESDAKAGEYIVGGSYSSDVREESALVARSLLTLDIDAYPGSEADLSFDLQMAISCAFIAYSTFNHTPDKPRVRVIIPLSRDVTPAEYRVISRRVASDTGIDGIDACSFVPNQAMFYPKHPAGVAPWHHVQQGNEYIVPDVVESLQVATDPEDDLSIAIAMQPLDLTPVEVAAYLRAFPAEGRHYDDWLMVGAAIKHQSGGSEAGYQIWLDWSAKSTKHDPREMRKKWNSLASARARPVTFASIIARVRDAGALVESDGAAVVSETERTAIFEELCEKASNVQTVDEYEALKLEVRAMPENILARDARAMIAAELVDAFGKEKGLTKQEIKRELIATAGKKQRVGGQTDMPPWLTGWVYIEVTCEYYNTTLAYGIKREAFNAKYGREVEVLLSEKTASDYALVDCGMPCVVDRMYWPGADLFFDYLGKRMVNTYYASGATPCDALDDEGREAVALFDAHLAMLFSDDRERRIVMDWMAFVCQNPGKRITWALLVQGSQGVGKTYLANVLQLVLGHCVRMLDPTAIAGRFTGWAYGARVIVVEEIRISGTNRFEILDRMKPFISNHDIQIEEKGRDHRTVPNFSSYLLLTNAKDSVPIVEDDRRYCPVFTDIQNQQQLFDGLGGEDAAAAYFDRLFDATRARSDALAYHLMTWAISPTFNATGRAPMTDAKREMMELSVSPERSVVEDMIDTHRCDIIGPDVLDVTHLNDLCVADGVELPKLRMLSSILLDMGYRKIDGGKVKISRTRRNHYVWFGAQSSSRVARHEVRTFHRDDDAPPF